MERNLLKEKIKTIFSKYKYMTVILLVGIALVLMPTKTKEDEPIITEKPPTTEQSIENRLAEILSKIDGAGKVQVLITVNTGEEIIYQTDEDHTTREDSEEHKVSTIMVTGQDKQETGLVRQVIPATYMGVVVVCEGADNPSLKLAIVDAVSKATGLGADRISVLKMK